MEQFIQEFKVEASGIIQKLQELLLALEHAKDMNNNILIEEIFRGIHTLKGSSRMFGFEKIEQVTHHLENTYDLIRSGQLKASAVVISLSLEVVDICAAILNDNYDEQTYDALLMKLGSDDIKLEPQKKTSSGVFQVFYHPASNIYERGVNPAAPLREIEGLGESKVFTIKGDKSLEEQANEKQFSSIFEILIGLHGSKEELEDVFLFMDASEFTIRELQPTPQTWEDAIREAEKLREASLTEGEKEARMKLLESLFKTIKVEEPSSGAETILAEATAGKLRNTETSAALKFINVKLSRLDEMMRLVSELVSIKAELNYRAAIVNDMALSNAVERLEKVSNNFRQNAFSMRLVPLQMLSLKFQRMVRDLSEKLGKEVNLITEGLDTEIDKTIIHEIEAPVMHIIRNALDHGLETTDERARVGKDRRGLLKIVAFYAGANVFIQIQDDGRGLDQMKIRQKAITKGLINETMSLSEKETIDLIFEAGFSTLEGATEYSGRGVGMDVVKQKVKALRGSIEITTEPGLGTAFTIRLPLSLSILEVMHVRVGGTNYLLPHSEVEQCLSERLNNDIIQRRSLNFKYKNQLLPNLNLREIFGLESAKSGDACIIVVNKNDQLMTLEVDEIIGEEQLVVKPVDDALRSIEYLSGISVLGNGELAFLLDSLKLRETFSVEPRSPSRSKIAAR